MYILRCYFCVDPAASYLTSTWVFPTPSLTGIAFKDLKWNHTRDQVWNAMETGDVTWLCTCPGQSQKISCNVYVGVVIHTSLLFHILEHPNDNYCRASSAHLVINDYIVEPVAVVDALQ